MDAMIRSLERAASLGDAVAAERLDVARARVADAPSAVGRLVREFSTCGPCITRGTVVRETKAFWIVKDFRHGHDTPEKRIKKGSLDGSALVHASPCESCSGGSSYPMGYMD
jgi:hypothetical protein